MLFFYIVNGFDVSCVQKPYLNSDINPNICYIFELPSFARSSNEQMNILAASDPISSIKFLRKNNTPVSIKHVPIEVFKAFPKLHTLILEGEVETLRQGDFIDALHLKKLFLGHKLKEIPIGVLTSARQLVNLQLSYNEISVVQDNAFDGLEKLEFLDLAKNNLTIIKTNTFSGLRALQFLTLARNRIEVIEKCAFKFPALERLHLGFNKLTVLDDKIFSETPLLQYIDFRQNRLESIGAAFDNLQKLEFLLLDDNRIADISLSTFSALPSLQQLFLHNSGWFSNTSAIEIKYESSKSILKHLDLSNNQLTSDFDFKNIFPFKELEVLNIENNELMAIDIESDSIRKYFPKLECIFLSGNKWSCEWLNEFITNGKNDKIIFPNTIKINSKNIDDIECA